MKKKCSIKQKVKKVNAKKGRSTKQKSTCIPGELTELAYHYTTGELFVEICETNILDPFKTVTFSGEKPILWFSLHPHFEQTATKCTFSDETQTIRRLSMDETKLFGDGLVRFAYPAKNLIRWPEIGKQAGMTKKTIKQLENIGIMQQANPLNWMGSFEPIHLSQMMDLQIMRVDSNEWISINDMEEDAA